MAVGTGNRFLLSHAASVAMAETRLAARAAPRVLGRVAPIVAWAAGAIAVGFIIGLAAVFLPPLGAFGIVAVGAIVLLWVMPDLPLVWPGLIRKTFFVMLITDLCIPSYYTVQVPGLPWISARRLATFSLIVPFLIAIAASSEVRRRITERLACSSLIFICVAGYLVMATLSISTSVNRADSLSVLVDVILSWYVPFFAMIYIVRDNDDVVFILKIICFSGIFITAASFLEFVRHRNVFVDIFPKGMLDHLIENNPNLAGLLPGARGHFRNGQYRAVSIFVSPLSLGEFEAIVIPIALFFVLFRQSVFERGLGLAAAFGGIIGIFCSGSRGGYIGVLGSAAVFVAIWSIRKGKENKASLAPAIVGLSGAVWFTIVLILIAFWKRAHNMVLGGGEEAASNQGRYEQWVTGIPLIKSNPLTGHGLAQGGYLIHMSIDSYILSLLLETGIPGLIFFVGLLLLPIWYGLRNFLFDMSESGALAGALACSFIAFANNRLVLSERENQMLFFSLLAIAVVMNYQYARKQAPEEATSRSPREAYHGAESHWTGG
jgi:O-Antigen ligase